METDIMFRTEEFLFSYRVAGILIRDGHVLLQRPKNESAYSFPGGHVAFGETGAEALTREIKEELHADVQVGDLLLVAETFFPWGKRPCQQIGFYYRVALSDETQIPLTGTFSAFDEWGGKKVELDFCWVPISEANALTVYPQYIQQRLHDLPHVLTHFVDKQI